MKILKAILVSMVLSFPAAAGVGTWAADGIGQMTCKEVTDLLKKDPDSTIDVNEWARGFATGMNWQRVDKDIEAVEDLTSLAQRGSEPWDLIKPDCEARPSRYLANAWIATFIGLHLPKYVKPSSTENVMSLLKKMVQ